MWPVASFPQSFPKTFFGKPQSSLLTGSRSCQVSNGIKGSNATDYAGLRLDCTGGPAILFPFFAQSAEEPFILSFIPYICENLISAVSSISPPASSREPVRRLPAGHFPQ